MSPKMAQRWQPLKGAVDLHIHIGPDIIERYYDSIDLAHDALAAGMTAIVLKDQLFSSVYKAILTKKIVPDIHVFGGVVLNGTCGGLSQRSVAAALKSGAKIVWFPTVDAAYCKAKAANGHWIKHVNERNDFAYPHEGITVIGDNGKCIPAVTDILKMVASYDAIIATGHISPEECLAVIEANAGIGAKIIITHPNLWFDDYSIDRMREMVRGGAVLEFTMGGLRPLHGQGNPFDIARAIREIGYQNCCLSTDYGSIESCPPPEGLRGFCYLLRNCGIPEEHIEYMIKDKPLEMLGLK